jgi:hypothetical protein
VEEQGIYNGGEDLVGVPGKEDLLREPLCVLNYLFSLLSVLPLDLPPIFLARSWSSFYSSRGYIIVA